jgi:hypothetical protein
MDDLKFLDNRNREINIAKKIYNWFLVFISFLVNQSSFSSLILISLLRRSFSMSLLGQQNGVDVRQHSALGDGHTGEKL